MPIFSSLRFFCEPSREIFPKTASLHKLPYTIVGLQSFTGSSSPHFWFLLPGLPMALWVNELPKCSLLHSLAIWWCLTVLKLPLIAAFSTQFHKTNNVIKSKLSEICLQVASLQSCPTSLNTQHEEPVGREGQLAPLEPAHWSPYVPMSLPRTSVKAFSVHTVKASFLLPFSWLNQKQELVMESIHGSHGGSLSSLEGLLRLSALTGKQECG